VGARSALWFEGGRGGGTVVVALWYRAVIVVVVASGYCCSWAAVPVRPRWVVVCWRRAIVVCGWGMVVRGWGMIVRGWGMVMVVLCGRGVMVVLCGGGCPSSWGPRSRLYGAITVALLHVPPLLPFFAAVVGRCCS
jgi:hypothetical protein